MGEPPGVVRIDHSDRDGSGLVEWEALDPASLASGNPVQRGRFCDEDTASGYMAGVWDCTAFDARPGPYEVDEFMLLLEGKVVMALPDGSETTVEAGQAFVVPKGLRSQWKMPGYVRKVFMIVDDDVPSGAANASLGRVTVPDLGHTGGDSDAVERSDIWFANASGRMTVAVRHCAQREEREAGTGAHELVHVLAGAVTLRGGGDEARFAEGETYYVRAGTVLARACEAGTRLLEARYRPA